MPFIILRVVVIVDFDYPPSINFHR